MHEAIQFFFIGNNLSLDFVNTMVASNDGPLDLIENTNSLLRWAVEARLVDAATVADLESDWKLESDEILTKARCFRATLHELFTDIGRDQKIDDTKVKVVNRTLAKQTGRAEIVHLETGFEKRFVADHSDPEQLFATVANSAADLLCYGNLQLLKKCENNDCVLMFYDTSKNHSRRWCSMAHCGNRVKANKFYKRKQSGKGRQDVSIDR